MRRNFFWLGAFLTNVFAMFAQERSPSRSAGDFDVIIHGGTVYDGSGAEPQQADVAIRGDRIAGIGDFKSAKADKVIDAKGLAVAPGFINMLSWSTESLIQDGRSQSEIRQGVTTEIMGEGESMGPVNDRVREHMIRQQIDIKYDIKWNTLAEYLQYLEKRGISCNVASFIGATTIREYVIGFEDKQPTPEQLDQMRELVRKEMEAGALGIGTSLIYPPAFYAKTEELIELCKVAAKYQGKYISHMRSEGNQLFEALDELIRIAARRTFRLKFITSKPPASKTGRKMTICFRESKRAQKEGLNITRRHVHLHRRRNRARRMLAAVDGRRRLSCVIQAAPRPGDARENQSRSASRQRQWENLYLAAGSPGQNSVGRIQVREAKAAHGQDTC